MKRKYAETTALLILIFVITIFMNGCSHGKKRVAGRALRAGAGTNGASAANGRIERLSPERVSIEDLEKSISDAGGNLLMIPRPVLRRLIEESRRIRAENDYLLSQLKAIKNIDLEDREGQYSTD